MDSRESVDMQNALSFEKLNFHNNLSISNVPCSFLTVRIKRLLTRRQRNFLPTTSPVVI